MKKLPFILLFIFEKLLLSQGLKIPFFSNDHLTWEKIFILLPRDSYVRIYQKYNYFFTLKGLKIIKFNYSTWYFFLACNLIDNI